MPNELTDPHETPNRFVGKPCSFDHSVSGEPIRRLVGVIEAQAYVGLTQRGGIPDYALTVRGASGRAVAVSLVEDRVSIIEAKT